MQKDSLHSFHIPVMGIAYTIDSPIKVAHYGISSVLSLVDDILIEKIREYHTKSRNKPFTPIPKDEGDCRAKRITAYLNLLKEITQDNFNFMKSSLIGNIDMLNKYISMLPDNSKAKIIIGEAIQDNISASYLEKLIDKYLNIGSIDVNIMTKLDKENYTKSGEALPSQYNDAHAALRGFANSSLNSSLVLSAGMNPRLYSYLEHFDDFYPNENNELNKKVILKVSDYRSALIQGKFLAKKGIWISEYRVESGLNCGGHAFASDGYLLGPNLEEFKSKKQELIASVHEVYKVALENKSRYVPSTPLNIKITAQGGVGTSEEQHFLLSHYKLDSVGWGTPFLLVPEAVSIDEETIEKLCKAKEDDLYLSNISPLGVPFNSLKGNTKDLEKQKRINKNRPGSSCPKKFAQLTTEFTDKVICTASRQYQNLKIKELDLLKLTPEAYKESFSRIVEKSCICVGLGTASLLEKGIETKTEGTGVSVCPGPNMAYYAHTTTLLEMTDHIYGRKNIAVREDRPHFLMKELSLYIDYLEQKITDPLTPFNDKQIKRFKTNLMNGINYYEELFAKESYQFDTAQIMNALDGHKEKLEEMGVLSV